MNITLSPSPNHDERKHPVDMIVLHYTGMQTGQAAFDQLRNPDAKVSSHYLLWEDGRVDQLVAEDRRAWHAGVSSWQGDDDLNSRSIGIEIVNGGHDFPAADGTLPPYPDILAQAGIGIWADIEDLETPDVLGKGLSPGEQTASVRQMQEQLQRIGYDLSPTGTFDDLTEAVVRAFQRRWLPDRISGAADIATLRQIGVIQALYAAS